MDRLFLAANIMFSVGPNAGLLQLWKLKQATLLSSAYALADAKFNLEEAAQKRRVATLARGLLFVEATLRKLPAGIALPEKDRPILLAAIEGRATHLLAGDLRHFDPYFDRTIEGVLVQSPRII